jgi:hypothetical protein
MRRPAFRRPENRKRVASGSEAGHGICYPSFRIKIAI